MFVTFDKTGKVMMVAATPPMDMIPQLEERMKADGQLYVFTGTDAGDTWVEDADTDKPILRLRPLLEGAFDKTDEFGETLLAPGEVATFPHLDPCTVYVTGPADIMGAVEHPGGPWQVRFVMPGPYVLAVEPWPARRREFRFTVRTGVPA